MRERANWITRILEREFRDKKSGQFGAPSLTIEGRSMGLGIERCLRQHYPDYKQSDTMICSDLLREGNVHVDGCQIGIGRGVHFSLQKFWKSEKHQGKSHVQREKLRCNCQIDLFIIKSFPISWQRFVRNF